MKNLHTLNTFTLSDMPDLDIAVLGALELFSSVSVPTVDVNAYKHPLVVGSGNALAVGRIIFSDADAVFASESTYERVLASVPNIDGVVLISASGGKHAPGIARRAKELGKPIMLITNNPTAPAKEYVNTDGRDRVLVFPKNREPYTYNTSTYMGMILGATGEDPARIRTFLEQHVTLSAFPNFSRRDKYVLILPSRFSAIAPMLHVKFTELFGRRVARDIETSEGMKHAVTVVPSDELFISFGEENTLWGALERRLHIPLPANAGYATMLAVGYFIIGQIQKQHPPYFKEHIAEYTRQASEVFGGTITPIVE